MTMAHDMTTDSGLKFAMNAIDETPKEQYLHLWASLPCTAGSPWQHMNRHRNPGAEEKIEQQKDIMKKLLRNFILVADRIAERGGDISFEWPAHCALWKDPHVQEMLDRFSMNKITMHGCAAGLASLRTGLPIKKPWCIATTAPGIVGALSGFQCPGHEAHEPCAGQETKRTEGYTPTMAKAIHKGIREEALAHKARCALAVTDIDLLEHQDAIDEMRAIPEPDGHREKDGMPRGLWCTLATKTLHPGDPMCRSPPALEAVASELSDLRSVPTWDEEQPKEADALKIENPNAHIARIFPIIGVKNWEDPASHRWKGRVVLAGNNIKTAVGQWALFGDISAVPSTMSACRALLAAFAVTHASTLLQSDCLRAYTQAPMKGEDTYVRLPKAWWPAHWVGKYRDPVCRLLRALYGHPESGNHWAEKLGEELIKIGFKAVDGWNSVWVLDMGENYKACFVIYVDDLVMFGSEKINDIIKELRKRIDMEDPSGIKKYLGVFHNIVRTEANGHTITEVTFDMEHYFRSALEEYLKVAPMKLTRAATPFATKPTPEELEDLLGKKGQLAPHAASLVMKLMYGVRMAWPHLCTIVARLSSQISCWTADSDRRLHRVYCYINDSMELKLRGRMSTEDAEHLLIRAWPDADLAGDYMTTKSTSGFWLELAGGGDRCMPLAWGSKKQGSTAKCTSEAETLSLATCLRDEAVPMQALMGCILKRPIKLELCEDNAATITSIMKGYSPSLKSFARTHRISLGILNETVTGEPLEGEGEVKLVKAETAKHKGDVFTKEMDGPAYARCLELIGMS